ncbi:MAG: class I SAM-dependent methyltransferase [Actinobacteria bacterium]|nr:class I SAM-dependent methyltransferase [Actinomycetota bacterium]
MSSTTGSRRISTSSSAAPPPSSTASTSSRWLRWSSARRSTRSPRRSTRFPTTRRWRSVVVSEAVASAAMREPISTYYGLLRRIHELRQPSLYVEIGVHEGHSLAFVQPGTRIVGVDPEPKVAEPPPNTTIVAQTSDDFFADPGALGGATIDLAFADGLHWWEQTLRDVANLERHSSPDGVILIHDCNPIDEITAARERTTAVWSGDVWKTVVALRRFRPDLQVVVADVEPTGLAIVTGLDPTNTVVFDRYDEIVAEIDRLGWADIAAADRSEFLGLVAGDWGDLRPLVT